MNPDEFAAKLAAFGQQEAEATRMLRRAFRRLREVQRERCAFLQSVARAPMPAGLEPLSAETIGTVVAPKDEDGD